MRRFLLAAIIAAGFAMPASAHHPDGTFPPIPPGDPLPLPVTNLAPEFSTETYDQHRRVRDNGQFRRVTVSFTVPDGMEGTDTFRGIQRYLYVNGRRVGGHGWSLYPKGYSRRRVAGAGYLEVGRRYTIRIRTNHHYVLPEHPDSSFKTNSPRSDASITVLVPPNNSPPPPQPPIPPPTTTGHTHPYASTNHSHSYASTTHTHPGPVGVPAHTHPYAADGHTHAGTTDGTPHEHPFASIEHEHPYADTEHEHDVVPDHAHQASPGACRWEHRFNSFPAADSPGRGVLRISARKKGASVRIEAFARDDGAALPVQDTDNDRLLTDTAVTLGAANSIARFAVIGDAGQHVLIVSHAEHVNGMRAVTAEMVRQFGGTAQVVHPDVVEHCAPATPSARVE